MMWTTPRYLLRKAKATLRYNGLIHLTFLATWVSVCSRHHFVVDDSFGDRLPLGCFANLQLTTPQTESAVTTSRSFVPMLRANCLSAPVP